MNKKHGKEFKAKVPVEAIRCEKTIQNLTETRPPVQRKLKYHGDK